jgi:hypothetical protein
LVGRIESLGPGPRAAARVVTIPFPGFEEGAVARGQGGQNLPIGRPGRLYVLWLTARKAVLGFGLELSARRVELALGATGKRI